MTQDSFQEEPINNNGSENSLKTIYRPEDIRGVNYDKDLGDGGEYPFTRGLHAQGYRNYSWVQRNVCGFDLPEDTNQRIKYLMKVGQRGYEGQYAANIAFDLPTQIGIDCDYPMSKYEVGKCGVTCANLQDMRLLFDGLPLANTNVGMVVHGGAPVTLAMYIAHAEEQGISRSKLIGQVPNNPFCFIGGTYMTFPPKMHLRMMVDTIKANITMSIDTVAASLKPPMSIREMK